jgi:hypothetical protein
MSRSENRREFETTGVFDVRRMADGIVYSGEKLKDARDWLYEHDTKYQRRADIKSTIAIIISVMALIVSAAALTSLVWLPTRGASSYLSAPKETAPLKSGSIAPTPTPK